MTRNSVDLDDFFDPGQARAARGLLGWSPDDLAARASLPVETVADYEAGRLRPTPRNSMADEAALAAEGVRIAKAIRSAFESAGIEIARPRKRGEGVRFRRPASLGDRWSPARPDR